MAVPQYVQADCGGYARSCASPRGVLTESGGVRIKLIFSNFYVLLQYYTRYNIIYTVVCELIHNEIGNVECNVYKIIEHY